MRRITILSNMEEQIILQVVADQRREIERMRPSEWVKRMEEQWFDLQSPLAQIVIGVRRSGKSVLCHKVLHEAKINYAFINFDDDRLANIRIDDLNTVLTCLYRIYGDFEYLFLDEVQNVDGWHLFVNRLLRQGIHIVVTGSNAKLLSAELATHLAGRYNEIRLFPFSFAEYCEANKIDTTSLTTQALAFRQEGLLRYLQDGGFPELLHVRDKRGYVQQLVNVIIHKDIRERYHIRLMAALERLADYLMGIFCQEVVRKNIATTCGITSMRTIDNYIAYLRQAYLLLGLHKYSFKAKERITQEKNYVIDVALLSNRNGVLSPENWGWRLENVVYIELLRRAAANFQDIFYYKHPKTQKEVDFMVCERSRVVELIQVCYALSDMKTYDRETSSLWLAAKQLHCSNLMLVVLEGEKKEIVQDDMTIHIIPAMEWLLQQ